jgi:hypothetical protein
VEIIGIAGLSTGALESEIARGAKFVQFEYCVSAILVSFKRQSDIYFIRTGESTIARRMEYSLMSLALGWWGIPWGPIWTVSTIVANLAGGKNVTPAVLAALAQSPELLAAGTCPRCGRGVTITEENKADGAYECPWCEEQVHLDL